jgi:hypothetical protein
MITMKQLLLVLAIGAFAACNNSASTESKADSAAKAVTDTAKAAADTAKAKMDTAAKAAVDTAKAKMDSAAKKK